MQDAGGRRNRPRCNLFRKGALVEKTRVGKRETRIGPGAGISFFSESRGRKRRERGGEAERAGVELI